MIVSPRQRLGNWTGRAGRERTDGRRDGFQTCGWPGVFTDGRSMDVPEAEVFGPWILGKQEVYPRS